MATGINYNARTFDDYKTQLRTFTQRYYPTIINDFQDSAVGSWFMDLNAAVGDDLGYYSDKMFQETQLDYAQERKSLLAIARTNGLKVTGKRPSMLEAKFTCWLPVDATNGGNGPDWSYAPIINKGTQASGGGQTFEVEEDINFAQQFNSSGVSDRVILPLYNSNNSLVGYSVSKLCVMTNGQSKIYKQNISPSIVEPFMGIVLPDINVINIESVIVVDGFSQTTPSISDFMSDTPSVGERYYEFDSLIQDSVFTNDFIKTNDFTQKIVDEVSLNPAVTGVTTYGNTFISKTSDGNNYGYIPTVGKWLTTTKKFITEYTDKLYCKLIFGASTNTNESQIGDINNASSFSQYLINKMVSNKNLGELPQSNSTIYVYYRVGGGKSSNIASNVMTNINFLSATINGVNENTNAQVKSSITVTNTIPSVSGRDELTNDEIRYLIKYNNSAQNRCVTINDYYNRIMTMPSKFGLPIKINVSEVNNKVLISMLGLDYDGTLSENISEILTTNIANYLSEYRMINDYVEIQPGKIINLQFQVDVSIENNAVKQDVVKSIIMYIGNYMDINSHKMGDEIYVSKMKSDIGNLAGVKNLIDFRVYNVFGGDYSYSHIKQPIISENSTSNSSQIDLTASDGVLYSDVDTMFEIKKPTTDITVQVKSK